MPPSGFNKKAVNGLLTFIEACYEDLLKEIDNGLDSRTAIQKELNEMKLFLKDFKLKK